MRLTYDTAKDHANQRKHGIGLAEVEGVFSDPNSIAYADNDHDEDRFVVVAAETAWGGYW